MALELHILPQPLDRAIGANEQRSAQGAHELFTVPLALDPQSHLIQPLTADIGQQREGECVFGRKCVVRGKVVRA